jgi:hypothetical protein
MRAMFAISGAGPVTSVIAATMVRKLRGGLGVRYGKAVDVAGTL